jgi:hypothetical protein
MLFRKAVLGLNPVYFSWVKRKLHTEFQLPILLRSGSFMVGDSDKKGKSKVSMK